MTAFDADTGTRRRVLQTSPQTEQQKGHHAGRDEHPGGPAGFATVNPFISRHDTNGLIEFLKRVFRATEATPQQQDPRPATPDADSPA